MKERQKGGVGVGGCRWDESS